MKSTGHEINRRAIYTIVALLISLSATTYWLALVTHAYWAFEDGSLDLTHYSYNLYFNIHYLHYGGIAGMLQFLTFGNHISPDMLLMLPFFYAYPHSLTLLYIQTITICLTSFLVFAIARDLIKDDRIAMAMLAAFLLNPGITGILTFDFHIEFVLVPAYLLVFYSYMKSRRKLFAVSLLLLLGALEIAPVIALTMGIGLFSYELLSSRSSGRAISREKRQMIAIIVLSSIATGAMYYASIRLLAASYGLQYPGIPQFLQIGTGSEVGFISQLHGAALNPISFLGSNLAIYSNPLALFMLALSMAIVLFGFGLFALKTPSVTFLLSLQWLVPVIAWSGKIKFLYTGYMYYGYTLGSTIAASIIGAISYARCKNGSSNMLDRNAIGAISVIIIALMLSSASLILAYAPLKYLATYGSASPEPGYNPVQVYQIARLVPQNASLMTQDVISPHLGSREYLETTASWEMGNSTYFVPDYILISHNASDAYTNISYYDLFQRAVAANPYVEYASSGNVVLYKRK
ncbi:MAG: DUF2079 domain-containing protein [Candidatus Micrarchaeota archaeon]|nr:DUF2079 domain-containing protein [Candidatus Micrarchaeota archaeon]